MTPKPLKMFKIIFARPLFALPRRLPTAIIALNDPHAHC